jgi:hypothetical protein
MKSEQGRGRVWACIINQILEDDKAQPNKPVEHGEARLVNTESFLVGRIHAFIPIVGAPRRILYDNTRVGVAQITGGGEHKPTGASRELQSHCLLGAKFGRPDRARQSQRGRAGA